MRKNESGKAKIRISRLKRQLAMVIACGSVFSVANAADGSVNIFDTLAKACDSNRNGSKFADAVLDKYRSEKFPSPKTGGFTVTSVNPQLTSLIPLKGACLVKGTIQPTSPGGKDPFVKAQLADKVPDINFQVYVPSEWNGKLVQLGGGAFAWPADLNTAKLAIDFMSKDSLLAPGVLDEYAVIMSDAGNVDPKNQSKPSSGGDLVKEASSVADIAQQELVKDFGRDSIKKSLDVGLAVVNELTKKSPTDRYFVGFSTGGRQALMAVANWPDAYDGAVSGAPSAYVTRLITAGLKNSQIQTPGDNPFANGLTLLGYIFGNVNWSDPTIVKDAFQIFKPDIQEMVQSAINSGAKDDPAGSLMGALEPVWNVKPADVNRFLKMPANANGKKKKIILFQGTSDIVVSCTQTAKFVRDAADLYSKDFAGNLTTARAFFIKDFSHGFFTAKGNTLNMAWNPVAALDKWVRDDNAIIGAPRNALNPAGDIPSAGDLKSWGCAPSDFQ